MPALARRAAHATVWYGRVFEALVADNLDLGRPDTVKLVFDRRIVTGPKRATPGVFKTKVVTRGVDVTVNAFYRHSRIKQYLKNGRALRIETVISSPIDLRVNRRLVNLNELQGKARAINARLLDAERVGQGCVLASPAFARVAHPPSRRAGGPRPYGSATLGSWPWPAPWPPTCTPTAA